MLQIPANDNSYYMNWQEKTQQKITHGTPTSPIFANESWELSLPDSRIYSSIPRFSADCGLTSLWKQGNTYRIGR
jgi:hypothetical protein